MHNAFYHCDTHRHETTAIWGGVPTALELSQRICEKLTGDFGRGCGPDCEPHMPATSLSSIFSKVLFVLLSVRLLDYICAIFGPYQICL